MRNEFTFGINRRNWEKSLAPPQSSNFRKVADALRMQPGLNFPAGKHRHQNSAKNFSRSPPIFVIELRSAPDDLISLQDKMFLHLASGVRLGWLFNPQAQQVEIYRQGQEKAVRSLPTPLCGETVLPRFELPVDRFTDT